MLAYTYIEHGRFGLLDKPKPELKDSRDAIVRVTLGSICTSDLHIKHGSVPRAVPGITVGHEMVGVVEQVGSRVTSVKPGDRVTVNVETFCGECFFCQHGYVNNCTDVNGGWAICIPMFKDRRFIYALSLVLGGIGFISTYFVHSPYVLFVSFLLIGCAWAAMLALPFTILTNALSGGHMGTYLGLFNGTICIPQIVAAALGGSILALFTPERMLPPEINMLVTAGVMLIIGAACVYLIKETKGERA